VNLNHFLTFLKPNYFFFSKYGGRKREKRQQGLLDRERCASYIYPFCSKLGRPVREKRKGRRTVGISAYHTLDFDSGRERRGRGRGEKHHSILIFHCGSKSDKKKRKG